MRRPHAVMDLKSRQWKARKIEQLLQLDQRTGPLRMLEVGTGSGGISHYFGAHHSGRFTVEAVDVIDNRQVFENYAYTQVTGTDLPFEDASFDIVLSNHVIEHVGDRAKQEAHLAELGRVMRGDGVGYLAVPNRWMLIEPHYRLIFLSWWPHGWRSAYLRLMRRGVYYDCEPLTIRQADKLLGDAGFHHDNLCVEALRATIEIENPRSIAARAVNSLPESVLAALLPVFPTLIYKFRHASSGEREAG